MFCGILVPLSGHDRAGGASSANSGLFVTHQCALLAFFLLPGVFFVRDWSLSMLSHSKTNIIDEKPPICLARLIGPDTSWEDWIQKQAQIPSHLWCGPSTNSCHCTDPFRPSKRGQKWDIAFERNKAIARNHSLPQTSPLDMVMFGLLS